MSNTSVHGAVRQGHRQQSLRVHRAGRLRGQRGITPARRLHHLAAGVRVRRQRRPVRAHSAPLPNNPEAPSCSGSRPSGCWRWGCGASPRRWSDPSPVSAPGNSGTTRRPGSVRNPSASPSSTSASPSPQRGSRWVAAKSSGQQNAGMSAQLMQSGWGKALLIAVGLGFIAVGGYHVYKGASKKFLKDLRVSGGTGITAVGVTGYVAKGLALAGIGVLVIMASLQSDPSKSTGLGRGDQDGWPGAVRQDLADLGRDRTRRVRRVQLRAKPPRPDVVLLGSTYWNDSTSAAS